MKQYFTSGWSAILWKIGYGKRQPKVRSNRYAQRERCGLRISVVDAGTVHVYRKTSTGEVSAYEQLIGLNSSGRCGCSNQAQEWAVSTTVPRVPQPLLIITRLGRVTVSGDFGLSRIFQAGRAEYVESDKDFAPGTPSHLPPEGLLSACIRLESDIFAFGVLMWEM